MITPEGVLARARALATDGYDEIPLHLLLGPRWESDSPEMEALSQLLRADLIRWTNRPGFLEIVDEHAAERRSIPRNE